MEKIVKQWIFSAMLDGIRAIIMTEKGIDSRLEGDSK